MKKLNLLLIILILLNITLASAEEMNLWKDETKEFKGLNITLQKVGNTGSVRLKVGSLERTITKGTKKEIQGVEIKLLESSGDLIKINISMTAECLQDKDCNDSLANTKDTCHLRECKHTSIDCCLYGDKCVQVGSVATIDRVSSYCSPELQWLERKAYKTSCINNYECLTDNCNSYCRAPPKLGESYTANMAPSWLMIILAVLIFLKYILFVIDPKRAKKINSNYLRYMSDNYFRIFAFIACIIAIFLIIWTIFL